MKSKKYGLALALLLLVMPMTFAFGLAAEPTEDHHLYELVCTSDGVADGKVELELYIKSSNYVNPVPIMDAGAFGIRFPKWMKDVTFTSVSKHVNIGRIVFEDRYAYPNDTSLLKQNTYMAFSWTRKAEQIAWEMSIEKGAHMFIGTFSLTLPANTIPNKTDIGQLDWLKADEAIAKELGESVVNPADEFNLTLWNPTTGSYQGYYQAGNPATPEEALLKKTDVALNWTPPVAWKNAFSVLSYNPKNSITVTLLDATGTAIAGPISTQEWVSGTTKTDSAELYSATDANANLGIGAYYAAVDFESFKNGTAPVSAVKDTKYILRMEKPGHLTKELLLTATDTNFANCTGLPTDGDAVYLPAGDVNPITVGASVVYGDGRINMADRGIVLGALGKPAGAAADMSYLADIDGDGRVTKADLSILMSPENFRKIQVKEGTA